MRRLRRGSRRCCGRPSRGAPRRRVRRAAGGQEAGSVHFDDGGGGPGPSDPLQSIPDAVFQLDRAWRFTYVNRAGEVLLGAPAHELVGRGVRKCLPQILGTLLAAELTAVGTGGEPRAFEYLHEPLQRWYEIRANPDTFGVTVFLRDIDDWRRADQVRNAEMSRLTAILESLPAATVLVGGKGRILTANRAWMVDGELMRQNGIEPGGVGDDYLDVMARGLDPEDHAAIVAGVRRLRDAGREGRPRTFDHEYSHRVGPTVRWFRRQAARVESSKRVVISHIDVTERVCSEQALAWQARHDELTGLPNRPRMLELIGEALHEPGGRTTALLYVDLDGFKTVNDSLGHQVGDALLRQVAYRLVEQVRPGDAVGRLGDDQFVVLAQNCDSTEAAALAYRLQASFALPFAGSGITVPLSASIGVAVADPGGDATGLLSDADSAMYAAKASGRDQV